MRINRALMIAVGAAAIFPNLAVAGAPRCSGDACDKMVFQKAGSCYTSHNTSARRVKVRNAQYLYELQPGETAVMKTVGGCTTDFGPGAGVTAVYLTPAPGGPTPNPPPPPTPPDYGPINKTVSSGDQPSGDGKDWSQWYSLCNDPLPAGYVIQTSDFRLEGDRGCGAWSNCRQTTSSSTQVCWEFQLQGHDEGGDRIRNSRGLLHYVAVKY